MLKLVGSPKEMLVNMFRAQWDCFSCMVSSWCSKESLVRNMLICFCQSTTAVSSTHPAATVEAVAVVRYCWVLDPPYHQVYTVTNRHTSSGGISELGEVSNGITKDILFENLYQNIVWEEHVIFGVISIQHKRSAKELLGSGELASCPTTFFFSRNGGVECLTSI